MISNSKLLERKAKLKYSFKKRTEWWSRVFASPIANFILIIVGDWKFLTPNKLTITSFLLVLLTAILIYSSRPNAFIFAAVILQFAYILDCMDGQLARYRKIDTPLGGFLDKSLDCIKFPFVLLSLTLVSLESFLVPVGEIARVENTYRVESGFINKIHIVIIIGLGSVLFVSLLAYMKEMKENKFGNIAQNYLTRSTFFHRNMRFFLFEEAQWYFIVSLFLVIQKPILALWAIFITQGILASIEFFRIILLIKHQNNENR